MESGNAESACVHGRLRRCAKDGIMASEESWMQQDLGGAAVEELEGVRLHSQSGTNTRRGGSRTGRWSSGDVRGRSGAVAASRGWTDGGGHGVELARGFRARDYNGVIAMASAASERGRESG
jgi:hypothetical protein